MSEELKPCPFCGSSPVAGHEKDSPWWRIECKNDNCCGAAVWEYAEDKAVAAWNARPTEDALRARVAELEARLDIGTGNMYDVVVAENAKLIARQSAALTRLHNMEAMLANAEPPRMGLAVDEALDQTRRAIAELEGSKDES